ncbi:hypothetical protein A3H22_03415 [Candidatus Peribacteria bacterium RIFCSPLOWO2_12_FULL_55_15]|nr:MAG: hypothetical protein A2789_01060 [Candidatus Peribacteria bacterium RIFCSPHIGHO2_01_FULL_54_22]OGJ62221.1 MAG: hypothetical protein A3D12_00175 [Candidatus Peribacteria bacterium RIFCSPHIGHO2_02_FULL_55_24]OGJ64136.1 MAG: hypothetical protein A3E47_03745 [Candidatus Peribacteria bacterium RIFCSPHIGHO2_12_FULL_54_10]OGJ69061.1 MAG: hypothetical protein A2947_00310 [Candidatus Peribacteria bacterium RIFCSPLOWO2_01_FULL_54_110]OGJ69941.1 MAG: hypothetical protein A3H90_00960 [Candidatus Pe
MMQAFILAGGFATRLWPLTEKRSKPLLPLIGKPLLTHIVGKIPQGMQITVSTNATFAAGFAAWKETHKQPITIVVEKTTKDTEKLGALGAVAQWIRQEGIIDDVLLLTGDNYFGFSLKDFLNTYHRGIPIIAAYNIGDTEKAKTFGIVTIKHKSDNPLSTSNIVAAFEEKPTHTLSTLVSTGCSILPHETLPILVEYAREHPDNIGGIFEELLRRGKRIDCFIFNKPWFDIGSYDAYLEATRALVPPGKPVIHPTASIDEESRKNLAGSIVIGAGTMVTHSSLQDTILFDNCRVIDCVLDRCILDDECKLHGIDLAGKMLRSGTTLTNTPLP